MEVHAAQPDEDNREVSEVSAEDFPRNIFKIAGLAIEIVDVGV
jgi:hypothetical protein